VKGKLVGVLVLAAMVLGVIWVTSKFAAPFWAKVTNQASS
jgi:hypothetical protein